MNDEMIKKMDGFTNERYIVVPIESFKAYSQHQLVQSLYLTDIGYFPHAKHHFRERKEGIKEYILIYCTEGQGFIELQDEKYEICKNDVFCIPKGVPHKYYASQENPWSILWVHFNGANTQFFPLDSKVVKMISSHTNNRMVFLYDIIFRVLNKNYTLGNFIYLSQVLSLLLSEVYFREKSDGEDIQNKHLTSAIRYMYKNINKTITLKSLSLELKTSISNLNSIFKKYTNHSPMDFFIEIKMEEACKLLKLTEMYVYEVSQELGYSDPYYFSRIFKKNIGMSPKEYKKSDFPKKTL